MPEKERDKEEKETTEAEDVPSESQELKDAPEAMEEGKKEETSEIKEILSKKNEDLLNRLKYLQAEFENLQKRTVKERQEIITYAQERLLLSILPVLDDLDKAVDMSRKEDAGLSLIRDKLLKVLEEHGLSEIPTLGQKFDAFVHEAVEYVNDDKLEDGSIKDVVQKGYRCNLKVIRPSLVIVVKNEGEKDA